MNTLWWSCSFVIGLLFLVGACASTSSQVSEPGPEPEIHQEKATKLDNVRLLVRRFDESFRFWRDTMGFEVSFGQEGDSYAHFIAPGGGDVAIFERAQMAEAVGTEALPPAVQAQDTFCLIFEVPNVDESYAALVKRGVEFVRPPTDKESWGIRTAHLRDPEGNLIEIMTSLNR